MHYYRAFEKKRRVAITIGASLLLKTSFLAGRCRRWGSRDMIWWKRDHRTVVVPELCFAGPDASSHGSRLILAIDFAGWRWRVADMLTIESCAVLLLEQMLHLIEFDL